jgi:hypothetical protein
MKNIRVPPLPHILMRAWVQNTISAMYEIRRLAVVFLFPGERPILVKYRSILRVFLPPQKQVCSCTVIRQSNIRGLSHPIQKMTPNYCRLSVSHLSHSFLSISHRVAFNVKCLWPPTWLPDSEVCHEKINLIKAKKVKLMLSDTYLLYVSKAQKERTGFQSIIKHILLTTDLLLF